MTGQPPKARRGCLFYGCFTLTVCLVAIIVAVVLGLYRFRKMVGEYTETGPEPVPAVTLPPAQLDQLQRRVDSFRDAVNGRRPTPPLVLNAQDINALIASDPELSDFKGKVFVKSLENGRAIVQMSVPLKELAFPMFRDRYLNGTATVEVSFQNGLLMARIEQLVARGKPLTGLYLNKIKNLNLAAGVNDNPRASVGLNRLQSLQLQDGDLVLTPKEER
jgi:hypothetical protein